MKLDHKKSSFEKSCNVTRTTTGCHVMLCNVAGHEPRRSRAAAAGMVKRAPRHKSEQLALLKSAGQRREDAYYYIHTYDSRHAASTITAVYLSFGSHLFVSNRSTARLSRTVRLGVVWYVMVWRRHYTVSSRERGLAIFLSTHLVYGGGNSSSRPIRAAYKCCTSEVVLRDCCSALSGQ